MKNLGEKFECYSTKLQGFLMMKGIRYEYTFVHNETGKRAWVYKMDTKLSIALTEWRANKSKLKNNVA